MTHNPTKLLLNGWLDGAVRGYAYVMGATSLKTFLRSAAEVLYSHLQEAVENQGIVISGTDTFNLIENISKLEAQYEVQAPENVTIRPETMELVLVGCPYAEVCSGILSDLVEKSQNQRNIPCFRSELYMAACSVELGEKNRYLLTQFAPGHHCTIKIEKLG